MFKLKVKHGELIYIDAFAGVGWSEVRKKDQSDAALDLPFDDDWAAAEMKFIAGSPIRALRTGRGFDQYYFFEADHRRSFKLGALKRKFPHKTISIKSGDANIGVQKLARRFHVSPYARGVAFLDPYGPHLHWKTVEALANTGKVDVIINFPLAMAINRLIKKDGDIPDNWVDLLDKCFGTHEWHELAYPKTAQDLFGEQDSLVKGEGTARQLLELYHRRLKKVFGHVVEPALVRNNKGMPLYYLMWAASNPRGANIAKHIMSLGERVTRTKG